LNNVATNVFQKTFVQNVFLAFKLALRATKSSKRHVFEMSS
jgi:hypothetical protein